MPRDTKSKLDQVQPEIQTTPSETLANLSRYMEAAGYDASHPWRLEIGAALAKTPAKRGKSSADLKQALDDYEPMTLALANVNATDLGLSIINELETLFRTIEAVANVGDLSEDSARHRLATIRRTALLAAQFADDRGDTFSFYRDEAHDTLATLRAGAA